MRKRNSSEDERLRLLERTASEGGRIELEVYLNTLVRIGKTPREIGRKGIRILRARKSTKIVKKIPLWLELLEARGADAPRDLGIKTIEDAKRIERLMNKKDWVTVIGSDWKKERHEFNVEAVIKEIDTLLETFGVESIQSEDVPGPLGYWMDTLILYCNTSDGYDSTVCYNTREDSFGLYSPYDALEEIQYHEGTRDIEAEEHEVEDD